MTGKLGLVEPRISLLEYTMPAASDGLFEEDRVFWFYVDTCQVNASKDLLHTHACLPVGCGFHVALLRWVKASSECIVCDTEVCEGMTIIFGRFIIIYGDWMAAVWRLLSFASSVMAVSLYCIGFCYRWYVNWIGLTRSRATTGRRVLCFWKQEMENGSSSFI